MNKQILLIGKPDSSKTVYLTQLYSRLQKNRSKLKLYKQVANLSAISNSRESLANGEDPQPTPLENHVPFELPIRVNEEDIDLVCPEYGGEQVNTIIDTRHLKKEWIDAIKSSDNWVLFIRLNSIDRPKDITDVTVTEAHVERDDEGENALYSMSEQTSFIELLQILLDIKQYNYHTLNQTIRLTIVLTCWDEMGTKGIPRDLLAEKLPLLTNFIETNWSVDAVKFVGLSALGFSLKDPLNQEKYQVDGPEKYGFFVRSNGEETDDITELIEQAL